MSKVMLSLLSILVVGVPTPIENVTATEIEEDIVIEAMLPVVQIPLPERKPRVVIIRENPEVSCQLDSSYDDPLTLSNRRNFITGNKFTYVVPRHMRKMRIQIQDAYGRVLNEMTIPGYGIEVKPNHRVRIQVY